MATKTTDDGAAKAPVRTPSLDNFGQDLTSMAKHGKLDPIIGRTAEIKRCCHILSRRKKNNPLLIGEAGVGKTQIAYGVAQKIVEKKVAKDMQNKRVILLDMAAVVAGTTYRGEFEERMKKIVNDCVAAKNIILFVDEIHMLVGAGSASGSMDAANLLKPALADGSIQLMGATTLKEYRENIESDTALTRRFQNVEVDPTSVEDTIEILQGLKETYEKFHKVTYTNEAIEACVRLSDRYINDRFLPDKAFDLLDESGARAKAMVPEYDQQPNIVALEAKFAELMALKDQLKAEQQYEQCAEIQHEAKKVKANLDAEKTEYEAEFKRINKIGEITVETIQELIFQATGIPISKMNEQDLSEMRKMKPNMLTKVIGQEDAVDHAIKAIRRARLGLKKEDKPISLMFIGVTGTGKTHLARTLAKEMFGNENHFYKFDMSEYSQEFTVSRFIGAPPGYVGYQEGGDFTEKIRRNPYSVILLDEIEKAHHTLYNVLLQALNDGYITDGLKRKCVLKNTIIIFTSNVGAKKLQDHGTGVGFATKNVESSRKTIEKGILEKELKRQFSPEFLNRVDETIYFNTLEREDILKITKLEVEESVTNINKKLGINLDYELEVLKFIADRGFDKEMGARPLYRTIQEHIADRVADDFIEERFKEGDSVTLRVQEAKIVCNINTKDRLAERQKS